MQTIWMNLGMAGAMYLCVVTLGPQWEWYLAPLSVVVLIYSFAHDWHEDAAVYREALAELAELDGESKLS